jgi:N6-L-threonylcarbamoyladenine synthase
MLVLAVETSCDETSVALVESGRVVRSNAVSSQIELHAPYGGVVPEIASRQHVRSIAAITEHALAEAGTTLDAVNAVAATRGPGLAGALLVGYNFARGLALGRGLPFAAVNHLEGHLHSVWLSKDDPPPPEPELPLLALIVSGGHTELVLMRNHGDYEVVGATLDDAAGEAFDKVARLLGLAYPGGPAIQHAAESGDGTVTLPRARLPGTYNFSFSGLKTAVLHLVRDTVGAAGEPAPGNFRGARLDVATGLTEAQVSNIASAFQDSVVDVLVSKTAQAAMEYDVASVAVVGGVAANAVLRARMHAAISRPLFVARPEFATDNAAMIASAAYYVPAAWNEADIEPGLAL